MALSKATTAAINKKMKRYKWYTAAYIKTIQKLLNLLGYKLTVDGIAGYYTINAIYDFQKRYGLVKDGLPGPKTLAKLKAVAAAKQAAAASVYVKDWRVYKYFKKSEFRCKEYCGGYPSEVYKKLVDALTKIRVHFGRPVYITSGLRCKELNSRLTGAASNSAHLYGKAADFYIPGVSKSKVLAYCKALKNAGYIKYTYTNNTNMGSAVHINV